MSRSFADFKPAYCEYCKKRTMHEIVDREKNDEGTGGELRCLECGSVRLEKIQGFDAALM